LEVLFAALSIAGAPHAIISDGGDIFYCNQAMQVYTVLGIGKERIEKGQPWQNYIETHFNIVRRMADAKFAVTTSWEQALQIHQTWMHDYNAQRHWAHEKREDGCHSPAQVLGSHKGTIYPQKVLDRILFATCYTRSLDKHGFLRFQNWKLYAEEGLAHQTVTIWIYEDLLKIEYKAMTLSEYRVELQEDRTSLQQVSHPYLTPTPFRSFQLPLPNPDFHERLLCWLMPSYTPVRRKHSVQEVVQLSLFDFFAREKAVGDYETKEANDLSSS